LRLSQFFFTFFIAFLARVHSVWCLLKDGFLFVGQTMSFIVHVLVHIFALRKVTRHLGARGHQKKIIASSIVLYIIIRSTTTE